MDKKLITILVLIGLLLVVGAAGIFSPVPEFPYREAIAILLFLIIMSIIISL